MLKQVVAAAALLVSTGAEAAEWSYEEAGVPIAYVDTGAAQLQFACRGGDLAMGFWVRGPSKPVAAAASMSVAITADAEKGSAVARDPGTRFAEDMPLIHSDGSSVIVRGPVARQWAEIAQKARQRIRVAYVRSAPSGKLEVFDTHEFGAGASSSAIRQVLQRCG